MTGISKATLSRYERGQFVPTPDRAEALAMAYGASPDSRDRLVRIASDMRAENRRVVLHRGGATFQDRIGRIESGSAHVATFNPTFVPGLLQTQEYMRAVFAQRRTGSDLEESIRARSARQQILGDTDHRFTQILTVGSLLWCASGPEVMAAQLDQIVEVSRLAGVRVGVIKAMTPAAVFPLHGFDMYDQRAVIVGTTARTAILTDPLDVQAYHDLFGRLEQLAVFGDAARAEIRRIADVYRDVPPHPGRTNRRTDG